MRIKVFGEARSATTYLEQLLDKHGLDVLPNGVGTPSGWKHGFPSYTEGVLHVLLMRDIYEWSRSMMTGFDSRWNGLKSDFGGDEDHWGVWEHPIACRTAKYISYINFAHKYGAVLLKTEHLKQHPQVITEFTGLDEVEDIERHVRLGIGCKDDPSRPRLSTDDRSWIDSVKNEAIESFVDGLRYEDYR